MCDPILVALLKMRPHDSQSSRAGENATPSRGTSPLGSYKEVPPPPPSPPEPEFTTEVKLAICSLETS